MPEQKLVKDLVRTIKNRQSIDKYINKLRNLNELDLLIKVNEKVELTLLMYCVKEGQLQNVKKLLTGENAANPCIQGTDGLTALYLAVLNATTNSAYKLEIIDELLKYQTEEQIFKLTTQGSLLNLAVISKRLDLVRKFLQIDSQQLPFIDAINGHASPLHLAAEENLQDIMDELLQYQPERQVLQINPSNGTIPLHWILETGDITVVEKILQYVPEQQLRIKNHDADTAFVYALRSKNIELVKWLIATYPFILELCSKDEFTPLHTACEFGDVQLVKWLLENGAAQQLTVSNALGAIPLSIAVRQHQEVFKLLLQYEPKQQLSCKPIIAGNILHFICIFGALESLRILFATAQKEAINLEPLLLQINFSGLSPLMCLIVSSFAPKDKIITMLSVLLTVSPEKQLLQQYVKPGQLTGSLPIHLAVQSSTVEVVEALLQFIPQKQLEYKNMFETPLTWAVLHKNIELVKLLLPYQVQPLLIDEPNSGEQISLLHLVVLEQEMLKVLLSSQLGRDLVNFPTKIHGTTLLHTAVQHRQHDVVATLIEYGASVNQVDLRGWSPMHVVCQFGDMKLFNLLMKENKAVLNLATLDGALTPLHIAALYGNLAVVNALIDLKVTIDSESSYQLTPLFYAILGGYKPVVELLLEKGTNPNAMVKISEGTVSLLFFAYQVKNYHAIRCLLKHGADLDQPAFIKNEQIISMNSFINLMQQTQPELYQLFKRKIPAAPTIKSEDILQANLIFEIAEKVALNPRSYLLELGFRPEDVATWQEELKEKAVRSKIKTKFFLPATSSAKEECIWLRGKITSTHPAVIPVSSPSGEMIYCYLDENNLIEQGCDPSKLNNRRFKFDGYHLKKLDNQKGEYTQLVKLDAASKAQSITYTHELKLNKLDRVLLFKLNAEVGKAVLYIGVRYLPGGLHTQGSVSSLMASVKQQQNCLIINWPISSQAMPVAAPSNSGR